MELVFYKKLTVSASGSDTVEYFPCYRKMTLKQARLVADTAVTADGSNYVTIKLQKSSVDLGSRAFNSDDMAAGAGEAIALDGGSSLDFSDLDELKITYDQTGASGMAFDGGLVLVFEPRRDV
jgi:hypothetical protein